MPIPSGPAAPDVPDWAPTRNQVADYIPHRTLIRDVSSIVDSEDEYLFDWDATTTPPSTAVDRLIAHGVAWVSARVSPMAEVSYGAASIVACLYAAAAIERGWPNDDSSLERANDLEKRMDVLLTGLIASNAEANTPDPGDPDYGLDIAFPVWSFPPANPRYDSSFYF